MAKKTTSAEIKKILKSGNMVIGAERSIKNLRLNRIEKILLSSNCPLKVEKDFSYYAGLNKTEIRKLDYTNEEIGVICKKPFSISVLAVLKGAK